jgi:hypothetical protein
MTDLRELRSYDRYLPVDRILGSFGAGEVIVIDLSRDGAQIEHSVPVRVATVGRFWFKHAHVTVSAQALSVWSKLARQRTTEGKPIFRSGLRIEDGVDEFGRALVELTDHNLVYRDAKTLQRKRKLRENQSHRLTPIERMQAPILPDQALLVEHVRQRLKSNPGDLEKWTRHAQQAVREASPLAAAEMTRYPEEVLTIWEYLERSVPLWIIARVLAGRG